MGGRQGFQTLEERCLLATLTWVGDVDNLWNTQDGAGNTNWDTNTLPADGDTLVFPAGAAFQTTNYNDTAAGNTYTLQFTGGGYEISGGEITIGAGGILDSTPGPTLIRTPLTVDEDRAITVSDANATLTIQAPIDGPAGVTLSMLGPGTLALNPRDAGSNPVANNFLGTTQVVDGTLILGSSISDVTIVGPLVVGDGTGASGSAVVKYRNTLSQIADDVTVTVNSDGLFDMPSLSLLDLQEAVGSVVVNGGEINTGLSALGIVGTGLTMNGGRIFGDGILGLSGSDGVTARSALSSAVIDVTILHDTERIFDVTSGGSVLDDLVIHGKILDPTGTGGIIKTGGGRMLLTGNNSQSGVMTVNDGILAVGSDDALSLLGATVNAPGVLWLTGGINSFEPITLNGANTLVSVVANTLWGPITLQTDVALNIAADDMLTLAGSIDGSDITKLGAGTLRFDYGSDFTGTTILTEGIVQANGRIGPVSLDGGRLQGFGTVGPITSAADGGEVSPGNSPGILNTGSISWNPATTFVVEIQGPYPGGPSGHDQLNVSGTVDLGDAVLDAKILTPSTFTPGDLPFVIIDNDGVDPIVGKFQLPDGTVLDEGMIFTLPTGEAFRISYLGGTGNDVTLTLFAPPVANDDFYVFPENVPTSLSYNPSVYTVSAPGVLGNDINPGNLIPNGGSIPGHLGLYALLVSGPSHGSLTLNGDGSFTYLPEVGYRGHKTVPGGINPPDDTFTYRATTGEVLTSDLTITADTPLPSDLDIPVGTVIPAGELDPRYFSNLATVVIEINPVNAPPVSQADSYDVNASTAMVASGTGDPGDPRVYQVTVAAPGVLSNDYSPENFDTPPHATPVTLTAILLTGPSQGTLVGGLNADGSFVYRPNPGFTGTDTFQYRALDSNGLSGPATTVTLNVDSFDLYNPVAQADFYSTDRNTALTIRKAGVLANDTDAEGKTLTASLVTPPSNGNVVLNPNGSFTYTPDAGFAGTDTFTYRAFDGTGYSSPATVAIDVRATNQKPTAGDDSYTMQADDTLQVPAPGVLGNDFDPEGDPLTALLVNPPQNGTLTLNPDGSFTYVPDAQFTGEDRFTYRASDGELSSGVATVTIHVQAIAPTTINLDPASDTGASDSDGITNDNTPTFFGTAQPNLEVRLYSRPIGSTDAPVQVGQTTADSQGNWRITSSQIADGQHEFFTQAFRPNGQSTGQVLSFGVLTIDTVAPRVVSAFLSPKTGQVYITFQDDLSGMAQPNIGNEANYSFGRVATHAPRAFAVNSASVQPSSGPAAPQTVVLNVFGGRNLRFGTYLFSAISGSAMPDGQGGISDVAGNALDGVFDGGFPSGSGQPGGNFLARFVTNGRDLTQASPINQFVPYFPPTSGNTPAPNIGFRLARTRTGFINGGQGQAQGRNNLLQLQQQRTERLAALQQARAARINASQLPSGPLGLQRRPV